MEIFRELVKKYLGMMVVRLRLSSHEHRIADLETRVDEVVNYLNRDAAAAEKLTPKIEALINCLKGLELHTDAHGRKIHSLDKEVQELRNQLVAQGIVILSLEKK